MKKKKLLTVLMASLFATSMLTSCGDNADANTNDNIQQKEIENDSEKKLLQKVYNEFKKEFSNLSFDDFSKNVTKELKDYGTVFDYETLHIVIDKNGAFSLKVVTLNDENGNKKGEVSYDYINGSWLKIEETRTINGHDYPIFYLHTFENGTFDFKADYEYDDNCNLATYTKWTYISGEWVCSYKSEFTYDSDDHKTYEVYSQYINDAWVKTRESRFINNNQYNTLQINLNSDGSFYTKNENTYDDNGNQLSNVYSQYINGAWVYISRSENTYDENSNKLSFINSKYENDAWTYVSKAELTYDSNNNPLTSTSSKYENDVWVYETKNEFTYNDKYNNIAYSYQTFSFTDGAWVCTGKYENTNDETPNQSTYVGSVYEEGAWVYKIKDVYKFDENAKLEGFQRYNYVDGEWVLAQ